MRIKTKLTLGVGLLFLLIILLGTVGASYIIALKTDTRNILADNYNTLNYSKNMLAALDDESPDALDKFEIYLQKQEKNITEAGEAESTQRLRNYFEQLKSNKADSSKLTSIRKEISNIMEMNMQAIYIKSELAKKTANTATFWIALTGSLCIIIAFTLLINFPSGIANPINELTESIKQIAAKNYSKRVHFDEPSEFGDLANSFNVMAEKLEEYNNSNLATLMMEKKRIETLINNISDPVLGLDDSKKVIFANLEALKIIGLNQEEVIGKYSQEISLSNDLMRELTQDLMIADTLNETDKDATLKIFTDGKESYFQKKILNISIVPTAEKSKKLVGHFIILRNITEYKEMDVAKTNFIATVSHELKTPIASIKMSLQLLDNEQIGKLNIEQKNLLHSIDDDAARLLKITGELLNMTQVESGNIQLSLLPADAKEILQYAVNATKTQAEHKQVKFDISYSDNLPKVLADSEKTAWVLINLISNAIRYSQENSSVYLSVSSENKKVKFSVKDTGQGIAPQYKDKIFDRYFRVPGSKREGTGLGLAISKEFIEAQGGSLTVETDLGAGSTFTVTLNSA